MCIIYEVVYIIFYGNKNSLNAKIIQNLHDLPKTRKLSVDMFYIIFR